MTTNLDLTNTSGVSAWIQTLQARERAASQRFIGTPNRDQSLVSGIRLIENFAQTVAFEPLVIDLPPPLPGTHYVVYDIAAIGILAINPVVLGAVGPASGLYYVKKDTKVETLLDAQGTFQPELRQIPVNVVWNVGAGNPGYAFTCIAVPSRPAVVTAGLAIRLIVAPNFGTAQPGPGAGSVANLVARVSVENDAHG